MTDETDDKHRPRQHRYVAEFAKGQRPHIERITLHYASTISGQVGAADVALQRHCRSHPHHRFNEGWRLMRIAPETP